MSDQPKPTGEWTNVDVEELWEKGGSIAVKDAINAALAAVNKTAFQAQEMAKEIADQLAVERSLRETAQSNAELWHEEMLKTDKQLAAEREVGHNQAVTLGQQIARLEDQLAAAKVKE